MLPVGKVCEFSDRQSSRLKVNYINLLYWQMMRQEIETAIMSIVKELFGVETEVELARPDKQFGDFSTNIALTIARSVGQTPNQIAEQLAIKLKDVLADKIADITVVAPGFINLTLKDESLVKLLESKSSHSLKGQTVVIEYSDPNPFKPLHAGHLYTTLVGDTIARLIEHAGAKTVRINYNGDVGLHVAKSIWAIIKYFGEELPEKLQEISATERPNWLGDRYVEGNKAYLDNETAKTEINILNKRIYQLYSNNDHNSALAQLYFICRQWSYDYFQALYKQLQIIPFDRFLPESEVTPVGVAAVEEQIKNGVYQKSDGAIIFRGEDVGLHTRVFITAEGLPTYETKDVGLSLTKWHDYHFDQSVIITANEQAQYMAVVIASMKQFAAEPAERTRHLTHGIVRLKGGVKMSSRQGNIVTAQQILDSARSAGAETGTNPAEETILAAVKYSFSKNRIGADIIYDPQESIALEGNSGPYLQYAYARARSILSKTDEHLKPEYAQLEPAERMLLKKITEFPEVIDKAVFEMMPHYICTYLYELAQTFNTFYESNRVIGDPRQSLRLDLVNNYANTLRSGLELLGISTPERL